MWRTSLSAKALASRASKYACRSASVSIWTAIVTHRHRVHAGRVPAVAGDFGAGERVHGELKRVERRRLRRLVALDNARVLAGGPIPGALSFSSWPQRTQRITGTGRSAPGGDVMKRRDTRIADVFGGVASSRVRWWVLWLAPLAWLVFVPGEWR